MWSAIVSVLTWLLGLIFSKKRDVSEELGKSEQEVQDQAKVIDEVKTADEARDSVRRDTPPGRMPRDDGFSRD